MKKVGIWFLAFVTLVGCRPEEPEPPAQGRAALPAVGPSWIAGPPAKPEAGRVVVGMLLRRPASVRFARLIRKERMQAFLAAEAAGKPLALPDQEVIESDGRPPAGALWAAHGQAIAALTKRFEARFPGVDLEFRQILADECKTIPLVLTLDRDLAKKEARDLAPWQQRGGILLRASTTAVPAPKLPWPDLERRLEDLLMTSPLVTRVARDPLRITHASRKGDDVLVAFADTGTSAHLERLDGTVIEQPRPAGDGPIAMRCPDPAIDPYQTFVVATREHDGLTLTRRIPVAALVGTLERTVRLGSHARIGGVLAARIRYFNAKSKDGIADVTTEARLLQGDRVLGSARSTSTKDGMAHLRLQVPGDAVAGAAVLDLGDQRFPVTIQPDLRISVVTDRTLYRETDKIHARVMVQRAGDGHPVADTEVDLVLGDIKKKVTTSAHGIASTTIEITEMRPGAKQLLARLRGVEVRTDFDVRAYERPTFTVRAEPAGPLALDPGQEAPVRLVATYVNGSPLVGGKVFLSVREPFAVSKQTGRTDAQGVFTFSVRAKPGDLITQRSPLGIQVRDAENRWQKATLFLRHATAAPSLEVTPLTDLVTGLPGRIAVRAVGHEGLQVLAADGASAQPVELDADGNGVVTATFQGPDAALTFVDAAGNRLVRKLAVQSPDPKRPLLVLDDRTLRVGDELRGTVVGPDGIACVDLWRAATLVHALEVSVTNGRGDFSLPLDALSHGTLQIRTSMLGAQSGVVAMQTVIVARADALGIEMDGDGREWRPGSVAQVDVSVRDASGEPTSCVLGYYGVDEALLALADMSDGHEDVFSVSGVTSGERTLARSGREARAEPLDLQGVLRRTFLATSPWPQAARQSTRTAELEAGARTAAQQVFQARVNKLQQAYLDVWKKAPLASLRTSSSRRETVQWAVRGGWLDAALLLDPWGQPLELGVPGHFDIYWHSAGPDGRMGTADDLLAHWPTWDWYDRIPFVIHRFLAFVRAEVAAHGIPAAEDAVEEPVLKDEEILDSVETDNDMPGAEQLEATAQLSDAPFEGPTSNGTIGIGGAAGGAFKGRGGSRDAGRWGGGGAYEPPKIRRDFDPTLCFVPELIIGADGKTTLEIPLKDSITTWRLRLVASRADGAVGVREGKLRVSQPLHLSPWLPRHVTVGDEWDLPVAIRNERPEAISATLALYAGEQIEILGGNTASVDIGPRGTGAATFHLKAIRAGTATVGLRGDTGTHEDRIERLVHVHPNAQGIVTTHTGNLASAMPFKGSVLPRAGDLRLELCPTALTELVSGFEGLIQCPHG